MTTLYTKNGSYPQTLPFRLRLSDGSTRTKESVTHELMLQEGYTVAPVIPVQDLPEDAAPEDYRVVEWSSANSSWYFVD
jgi:hypothetical protein